MSPYMDKPIQTFRVHPTERGGLVRVVGGWQRWGFRILIYRTLREMRAALKSARPDQDVADIIAFTDERTRTIYFARSTVTPNTVAHEFWHATILWAIKRTRFRSWDCFDWDTPEHERMAEAHGHMVGSFWQRYRKAPRKRK